MKLNIKYGLFRIPNLTLLALLVFIVHIKPAKAQQNSNDKLIQIGDSIQIDLYSLPSPDEIIHYINAPMMDYNKGLLNNLNIEYYKTSTAQLLALGIYLGDMAYSVSYDQIGDALKIFNRVETLGQHLQIFPPFPIEYRDRVLDNLSNKDSLQMMYQEVYTWTMQHLEDTYQFRQMTLISLGSFIESIYLVLNNVDHDFMEKNLKRRICDQEIIYRQIIQMFSKYMSGKEADVIRNDLSEVTEIFKSIRVQTSVISHKDRYDGTIMILNSPKNYDEISDLSKLKLAVNKLRSSWVNLSTNNK